MIRCSVTVPGRWDFSNVSRNGTLKTFFLRHIDEFMASTCEQGWPSLSRHSMPGARLQRSGKRPARNEGVYLKSDWVNFTAQKGLAAPPVTLHFWEFTDPAASVEK